MKAFGAVLDPPRHETEGGIALSSREDGWSQAPLSVDEARAERQYIEAMKAFEQISIESRLAPRKTFELRARWDKRYDDLMAAAEHLQRIWDDAGPGAALDERSDCWTVVHGLEVPFVTGDRVMMAFSGISGSRVVLSGSVSDGERQNDPPQLTARMTAALIR